MKTIFVFRLTILLNFLLIDVSYSLNDALKIKIFSPTHSDETVVRFLPNASSNFDANYDAWKLFSSNNLIPAIYTKIDSVSSLSINALPNYTSKQEIPLYVKIATPGVYTLQSIELGLFSSNASVFLEDNYTGMIYNFRNGISLTIYLYQTTINDPNRFVLHFSPPSIVNVFHVSCYGFENGLISIQKNGNSDWNATVKNNLDSIVYSAMHINDSITFSNMPAGAYTLYTNSNYTNSDSISFVINQPDAIIADFVIPSNSITVSTPILFFNNSENAEYYLWDFGDGSPFSSDFSPMHQYASTGQYSITLHAFSGNCNISFADSIIVIPDVTTSNANPVIVEESLTAFQSNNAINITIKYIETKGRVLIYNVEGKILYSEGYSSSNYQFSYTPQASGIYIIHANTENQLSIKKINFIK